MLHVSTCSSLRACVHEFQCIIIPQMQNNCCCVCACVRVCVCVCVLVHVCVRTCGVWRVACGVRRLACGMWRLACVRSYACGSERERACTRVCAPAGVSAITGV